MKSFQLILIITIAMLIIFAVKTTSKKQPTVSINNIYFRAEVAKTDEQKEKGLAKYQKIENDFVMVFPFNTPDYYTFWMKDMKFPIDIIYVRQNKIVDIFPNVKAPINADDALPIIRPKEKADTVLEINAGLSNRYKFKKDNLIQPNY